jgi:predicted nucleic acid-binding protein
LSSNSGARTALRRLKLDKQRKGFRYRDRAELPFIGISHSLPKLLLDTTVYIDDLQGKLPIGVKSLLRSASVWHSTVTECELAAMVGLLDPHHSQSAVAVEQIIASIERRPTHRIANPDRETWCEAGIVAGVLARLQQYGKAERRRALNDALIFLSAQKHGFTVLTRNILDFDLLLQLVPQGRVVFYDI